SLVTVRLPSSLPVSGGEGISERTQDSSLAVGLHQLGDLSRSPPEGRSQLRFRQKLRRPGPRVRGADAAAWALARGKGGTEAPETRAVWGAEYALLRAEPAPCKATRNPGPVRRATRPRETNSLQFPQPQRGPRAGSERRRGGAGGRAGASGLAPRPPRSALRGLSARPPPALLQARSGVEARPPEAPSGQARAEPDGLAGAGAAGRELLIRTSLADSLRPTMHRGGQPLKKRRGSFKMAELDQLPDEKGSLSNTWNEKYSSLQKTPVWKGRNTGPAVEMPFRNSKRSRLFSDEDDRQINTKSPKRNQRVAMIPQKFTATMSTPDKKASQKIGFRLRNLLKLPKAHKWCIYEWFYSNIDKPLFEGDNDFCVCLKESFPNLKTRKLTRVEWGKIRRLMGKPRRCSSAFFEEERSALKQKRQKIRLLQQRKVADVSQFKDLPDEIPLPLVIGTKVTARLRGVHDGLFTGQIDAVDTLNATYRVTFDRTGLGTHTIPDYEVLSNEPHETMPIAAFGQKQRPSRFFMTPPRLHYTPPLQSPITDSDPLLGQSPWRSKISGSDTETLGGFPVEFLIQVTKLSKILMIKKEHIKKLREMNTEAEKLKSYSMPIGIEFQRRYATIVLELEQLNKDLNKPTDLRRRCEEEAQEIVRQANSSSGQPCVENENLTDLIARLTAILLQIKNNVEIHVAHIQSGLSQMGNLHAFAANNTNRD
ncbi:hypothetical protein A6R68_19008, partial [Neotoma lepida]